MKQVFPRFLKPTTFFSRDLGLEFFSFPTRCLLYLRFSILLLSTEWDLKKENNIRLFNYHVQPLPERICKYLHTLSLAIQFQFLTDS
jgi:hypothetical protein